MPSKKEENNRTVPHQLVNAHEKWQYLKIVEDQKYGEKIKSKITLRGANTYHWKNGQQFYYWPETRLAGDDLEKILTYGYDNFAFSLDAEDEKAGNKIFGPFIANGGATDTPSDTAQSYPVVVYAQASWAKRDGKLQFTVRDNDILDPSGKEMPDSIPEYKMEARLPSGGDPSLDSVETNPQRDAETYVEWEVMNRMKTEHAKKASSEKDADLDDLADFILRHKMPPKRGGGSRGGGGGGGRGKAITNIDEFFDVRDGKQKELGDEVTVPLLIDISHLKHAKNGKGVVGARYSIPAKLSGGDYYRDPEKDFNNVVFSVSSGDAAESSKGPALFYALLGNGNGVKEVKSIATSENRLGRSEKKKSSKSAGSPGSRHKPTRSTSSGKR